MNPDPKPVLYVVEIVEDATGKIEHRSGPMVLHKAEKLEDGYALKVDFSRFSTRIVKAQK